MPDQIEIYRELFDATPFPLWLYDTETLQFLEVNQTAVELYGYSRAEFLAMTLRDLRPADEVEKLEQALARLERQQMKGVWVHRKKDGTLIFVSIISRPFDLAARPARLVLAEEITSKKKAEAEQAELLAILDHLYDNAPVGLGMLDTELRFRRVNKQMAALNGLPVDEHLNRTVHEALPHFAEILEPLYRHVLQTREPLQNIELSLPSPTAPGEIRHHLGSYYPVFGPEGELLGVASVRQDVTERHQTEERLRRQAEVLDLANVLIRDINDRIIFWNTGAERFYGWKREDAFGRISHELLQTVFPEPLAKIREQILATGEWSGELTHHRHDGSAMIVSSQWLLHRDKDGSPGAILEINNDITHSKRAEEQLRLSEERFRVFMDNSPVIALIKDDEGRYVYVNRHWLEQFGTEKPDWVGRTDFEFWPDEVARLFQQSDQAALAANRTIQALESVPNQSGGTTHLMVFKFPLNELTGRRLLGGIVVDITERIEAEEKIRTLNAELEQRVTQRTAELEAKNRELETFAYTVSHDLKAPLRGIDGYSRLLQEDYQDQLVGDGSRFINTIRQATHQMNQLIDDLLAWSRLDRRRLTPEVVNVKSLVSKLIAERADEISARGIAVSAELPDLTLTTDASSLVMALRNLLDNAIKFTRLTTAPVIEIGGRKEQNQFLLWVRDNGPGFEMQYHDRIFDIFQRLHRAEDYTGTGIGLAIVRKAMERVGGRAWAESAPGAGAVFYLELPGD
ncbi:MAG: PAS domain-containing protein [Blastocatellia bacterium]